MIRITRLKQECRSLNIYIYQRGPCRKVWDLHDATVDMTAEGVAETTVVTATVLEGLELAGKTTVCFWVGVDSMEVETSLERAALL